MVYRQALFGGGNGSAKPRETDRTAELGNAGVVQLQQSIMREQDDAVEHLERSVQSTRVRSPPTPIPSRWNLVAVLFVPGRLTLVHYQAAFGSF